MSKTTRQIGSPSGGYCCDPDDFSNPGQQAGAATGHDARGATSAPLVTVPRRTAEGNVRDHAQPRVSMPPGPIHGVSHSPRSRFEEHGK